jgi:hypothetical protein
MVYLLVGAVVLAALYWGRSPGRWFRRPEWRVSSGVAATGLLIAAAFVGLRGGEVAAAALLLVGIALVLAARWPRQAAARPEPPADGSMSESEARAMLGVGPAATREEIQSAYARLMRVVHPDHGGAPGLAVQLNLARERLLKGG